jgi:hypothetical protein
MEYMFILLSVVTARLEALAWCMTANEDGSVQGFQEFCLAYINTFQRQSRRTQWHRSLLPFPVKNQTKIR